MISIYRRRAFSVLLMVDAMLIVLHLLSRSILIDGETLLQTHELINLDAEVGAGTWWQEIQLAGAGGLCLLVAHLHRGAQDSTHRHWSALAVLAGVASLDEGVGFHEGLTSPMRERFDIDGGPLEYAWVIPALAALVIFALVFVRFWYRLPPEPRLFIAIGGAAFVLGAVGFEMIGGAYGVADSSEAVASLVVAGEEGLEMLGATTVIFGVLTMLRRAQPADGSTFTVRD